MSHRAQARGAHRVVICGGGAGGIELAVRLAARKELSVQLVDPSPTHLWKPLLHEVASGTLDLGAHEISYLALAEWRGFLFAQGRLIDIDRVARRVQISATLDRNGNAITPERWLGYDVLVVSVGGVTSDFGVPGVRSHAALLDSVSDAEHIHDRVVQACTKAHYAPEAERPSQFTVNIVGGGATGVELAAELRSTVRALAAYGLDNVDPDRFVRLCVFNADARLVPQLPERVSTAVQATLESLDIQIRNASAIVEVSPDALVLKSGERIASDLTIWAAGVKAPRFLRGIGGLETNWNDQIVVNSTLQSLTDPAIFAMGDCAAAPWIGTSKTIPPRAQSAHQQAKYLSRSIPQCLSGREVPPFVYSYRGSLLSLGEGGGVGRLMGFIRGAGLEVEGTIARLLYRWLYKRHLASLFGWWAVTLDALGNWMRSSTRPQVKLH